MTSSLWEVLSGTSSSDSEHGVLGPALTCTGILCALMCRPSYARVAAYVALGRRKKESRVERWVIELTRAGDKVGIPLSMEFVGDDLCADRSHRMMSNVQMKSLRVSSAKASRSSSKSRSRIHDQTRPRRQHLCGNE